MRLLLICLLLAGAACAMSEPRKDPFAGKNWHGNYEILFPEPYGGSVWGTAVTWRLETEAECQSEMEYWVRRIPADWLPSIVIVRCIEVLP